MDFLLFNDHMVSKKQEIHKMVRGKVMFSQASVLQHVWNKDGGRAVVGIAS